MPDFALTVPVVFIIFNRPDTTARVFAEIARARPPKLLVIGDGPRPNRAGEAERVAQARAILDRVDWPCEVLTNFSETNLGCGKRVASGIDWAFEQAEEAIILEDDCLPDPSFFRYCQELLERYRDDDRVAMISGNNFLFGSGKMTDSYFFSRYNSIWGWASWRRAWRRYDRDASRWPSFLQEGKIEKLFRDREERRYWHRAFNGVYTGECDTWDYQWTLTGFVNETMCIMPEQNLVSNIGFGENATHTTDTTRIFANMATGSLRFPLRHPREVRVNAVADKRTAKKRFRVAQSQSVVRTMWNALLGRWMLGCGR